MRPRWRLGKRSMNSHYRPCAPLTALIRRGQLLLPRADLVLEAGDEVLAVVHTSQAGQLEALLGGAGCAETR